MSQSNSNNCSFLNQFGGERNYLSSIKKVQRIIRLLIIVFATTQLQKFCLAKKTKYPDVFDPYQFVGITYSLDERVWMNGTLQVIVEAADVSPRMYVKLYTWVDPIFHPGILYQNDSYNTAYFQLQNFDQSPSTGVIEFWEDFTCCLRYNEYSAVKVTSQNYFEKNSCGFEKLSTKGAPDWKDNCGLLELNPNDYQGSWNTVGYNSKTQDCATYFQYYESDYNLQMVESTAIQLTAEQKAQADAALKQKIATMTDDEKKRLAAAALKQVMTDPNKKGKSKIYEVIKALSAMRLTKEDGAPSPVIILGEEGQLELATEPQQEAFLYQGSVGCAYNQKELQKAGITHILTCAAKIGQRFPKDFKYETLNLLDTPQQNIGMFFEQAQKFINQCKEENGRILVHCFAGKSRASTITLSYMMKEMKLDLKTSLDHLQKQRPIAQPNIGFIIQLKQYEKDLFGKCSDVPIMIPKTEKEKAAEKAKAEAGGSVAADEPVDEAEIMKGLKTAEQLEAEGSASASDQKQLSDAKELMSEESKKQIMETVAKNQ